jgi:uncharacterized C2H2 Zn-finger protein
MNFYCSYCDRNFKRKHHYNDHLKTNKHLEIYKNVEKNIKQYKEENLNLKKEIERLKKNLNVPTDTPHIPHIYPTDTPHIFKCEYCDQEYKTQKSKSRHTNSCLKKKLIDSKNKIIELEKENLELKNNSKQTNENFTKLALTSQKGNTNINNSSYNIIINQYKNAPNLILPNDLIITESLDKYIESGNPTGIINFLDKYYGSQVPPESRSLWCIDATRCKFVLRHNNEWLIDLDGNKFRELTFHPLQNIFYKKQKEILNNKNLTSYNSFDSNKLLSSVEFLGGFVDKKEQMKIIRDLSKKIYFKKVESDDNKIKIQEIEI